MERIRMSERPGWKRLAEDLGFRFHTMYGEPYWDETAAYRFTLRQIEDDLEDPTAELHAMCLDVVGSVVRDERALTQLAIPEAHWDLVRESWDRRDASLYGRFDLVYDGQGPAKLLEYNADTPTSLYETAFFQYVWLEQNRWLGLLPRESDQFNSLQDRLVARLAEVLEPGSHLHFASCEGVEEDRGTVLYLEDCALQAGLVPHYVAVERIGLDTAGRFADEQENVIEALFKLYPWEFMFRDAYGAHLKSCGARFFEPPWKAVLSNKGLLALLWRRFPGHPNLLPAWFDGEAGAGELGSYVRKPLLSREGANVEVVEGGEVTLATGGGYGREGFVVQALHPLPVFDGNHAVIGSWVVGDEPAGIGIREDAGPVTRDLSRFLPHMIC
jgi:glutathionylspermidine synthase